MQPFYICILLAVSACAREVKFNDPKMPILRVQTSQGEFNFERVDYLEALILPKHVTTGKRVNFPTSGPLEDKFKKIKADGDERGHLVASQFSGPPEWYNLSPQNARVNRNLNYQAITTDWYKTECEVRAWLQGGANRQVKWEVRMTYVGNSNRPDEYHLQVHFLPGVKQIDTKIRNPFKKQTSTFWICKKCGSNACTQTH